jgi:hypothetical protein
MKRKGMFDFEDLIWYLVFTLLIITTFIIISVPGCKERAQHRLSLADNELEMSVAAQELSGYLNAKMPTYDELEEKIEAIDSLRDTYGSRITNTLKFLSDNRSYYEGESFAEFLGFLEYVALHTDGETANLLSSIGSTGSGYTSDPTHGASFVFFVVTKVLFATPSCNYPGTDIPSCLKETTITPHLYVEFSVDSDTIPSDINSQYLDLKSNSDYLSEHITEVYQRIPKPDGGLMLVILRKNQFEDKR